MLRSRSCSAACAVLLPLAIAAPAAALTIDFEDFVHGEIVAAPNGTQPGYTLEVENFSKSFDAAVAFDTNGTGTVANDLRRDAASGWSAGNLSRSDPFAPHPDEDLGHILIIQANDDCSPTLCSTPHDEGRRPAGMFTFRLTDFLAIGFAFDLVDVDDTTRENGALSFHLLGAGEDPGLGNQVTSFSFADFLGLGQGVVYGDNSANRIDLGSVGHYNAVVITMAGSGGIDNLELRPVPEPAPAALVLLGLAALAARGRLGRP